MASFITWARANVEDPAMMEWAVVAKDSGVEHWSRVYEYPFVLANVAASKNDVILEAAGGSTPLQAVLASRCKRLFNVDLNLDDFKLAVERYEGRPGFDRIVHQRGDLKKMWFPDGFFDKVTCVSVLEHDEQPQAIMNELWRVLKPGGRLVCTFDVASYRRWNHNIDSEVAEWLVRWFGLNLPLPPSDALTATFPELLNERPGPQDRPTVDLKVVCFYTDKPQ